MSNHHHDDKKAKKLAQILKNRHTQELFRTSEILAKGRELEKEREEEMLAAQQASSRRASADKSRKAEPVWSARMQQIRNRNTGDLREAKERWNRFAGTAESGGRGL